MHLTGIHFRRCRKTRGQAMVELALTAPLFLMLLIGVISLGIGVFYHQQLTNAAREAARFASIHSSTSSQPTVSWKDPTSPPLSYVRHDRPEDDWPYMTAAARRLVFGLNPGDVFIAACWSGYQELDSVTGDPDPAKYDAPPPVEAPGYDMAPGASPPIYWDPETEFVQCTIDGTDPTSDPSSIDCNGSLADTTVDQASNASEAPGRIVANVVTAYACYEWSPPLAGFLLIPETVTLRAVISEPIQRQQ